MRKIADISSSQPLRGLTRRELEIGTFLVVGAPDKVIARQLGVSLWTVKQHVRTILQKLNVQNRTQAAVELVLHHGISLPSADPSQPVAC
jgi:DNA-binding NarL/FixJ family response regulator